MTPLWINYQIYDCKVVVIVDLLSTDNCVGMATAYHYSNGASSGRNREMSLSSQFLSKWEFQYMNVVLLQVSNRGSVTNISVI